MGDVIQMLSEFNQLIVRVKNKKLTTATDVMKEIESYFTEVEWSLLKSEWAHFSEKDRVALAERMFKETQ